MSSISANSKPGGTPSSNPTNSKQTTPVFNGAPSSGFPDNTARRLGRLGRTSTPDSEALASSDDESEARTAGPDSRSSFAGTNLSSLTSAATSVLAAAPATKTRRMSWLTETSSPIHTLPRKNSFAGPLTMSPTGSNPNTPSLDSTWGTHPSSAGLPRVGSLPWSNEIWNSASTSTVADRRESISRRGEHLTSPSSAAPLTASSVTFFNDPASVSQLSPATNIISQSQFPFSIPLHPTPKTYRSQSYSVGQLDLDTLPGISAGVIGGRSRLPHSGIPHRASRPSMLGDLSEVGLGKLKEDDNEEDIDPMQRMPQTVVPLYQSAEASKIEKLERENAMLRQQQQQYQNASARVRPRTTSAFGPSSFARPDDSDYAIDELDETYDGVDPAKKTSMGRRLSEYTLPTTYSRSGFPLDRKADINKNRAYWQSAPGFGDLAQSRRHSFADVPTRQASITSLNEATGNVSAAHNVIAIDQLNMNEVKPMGDFGGYGYDAASAGMLKSIDNRISQSHMSAPQAPRVGVSPVYYGGNPGLVPSPQQQQLSQGVFPNQFAAFQQMHGQFPGRTTSPHHNGYPIPQPRHNQLLHVVLFKCARADVFYIQEGTGLEVKPGDLVIVEADRGTDLGTVAKVNVDWQAAKELKEHYAEEHYKWLMMYSQNAKAGQDGPTGIGTPSMPGNGLMQSGTVGGMGPPGPHHMQEPVSSELKPKLIKRLAQTHEVTSLREKEGNEAKAKRVCMQKVKEHGLNMEILDAEFQMDWKKLTFYYFADNYINFNSLVTDLFKIYKTRIWMSAINPASFASPTLGLQAPSGIGPGAVGVSRNAVSTERRQSQASHSGQLPHQFQQQQPQHMGHIQQQTQHLMQQQRHIQPQQQNFGGMQGYTNGAVNPGVNMGIQGFNGYGNIPNVSHSLYNSMNPHSPPAVGNWNQEGQAGIQQAGNGGQQDNGDWMQQMQSLSINPQ